MISEENKSIPMKEMELCLMEMSKNLAVCGMCFRYTIDVARDMVKEEVMALLDFLQYYIEEKIYVEKSMTILLKEEGLDISITISGENDRLVTRNISDIIMSWRSVQVSLLPSLYIPERMSSLHLHRSTLLSFLEADYGNICSAQQDICRTYFVDYACVTVSPDIFYIF